MSGCEDIGAEQSVAKTYKDVEKSEDAKNRKKGKTWGER